jgi:hypothetical protein
MGTPKDYRTDALPAVLVKLKHPVSIIRQPFSFRTATHRTGLKDLLPWRRPEISQKIRIVRIVQRRIGH